MEIKNVCFWGEGGDTLLNSTSSITHFFFLSEKAVAKITYFFSATLLSFWKQKVKSHSCYSLDLILELQSRGV